jgi:hypothetical protein
MNTVFRLKTNKKKNYDVFVFLALHNMAAYTANVSLYIRAAA